MKDWYYVGMPDDPNRRVLQHNLGKTKSTKPFRPYDIVYTESYESKTECENASCLLKTITP